MNPEDFEVVVFDMMGKILYISQDMNGNKIQLNTTDIASGMYIINVFDSTNQQLSLKVIK